jgi:quinol monooxygenase YgiN
MPDSKVRVVAQVKSLPDKVDEMISVLKVLTEKTRQEVGCIRYDVVQNKEDPTDFIMVEEWENQTVLNAHFEAAHFKEAVEQQKSLVSVEPTVGFYNLLW